MNEQGAQLSLGTFRHVEAKIQYSAATYCANVFRKPGRHRTEVVQLTDRELSIRPT